MRLVLGIDAAWTATQPSGIALVRQRARKKWECIALAPSYASFLAETCDWRVRPVGDPPDCDALIAACKRIAGAVPDVIAIDTSGGSTMRKTPSMIGLSSWTKPMSSSSSSSSASMFNSRRAAKV